LGVARWAFGVTSQFFTFSLVPSYFASVPARIRTNMVTDATRDEHRFRIPLTLNSQPLRILSLFREKSRQL
jgi:hypothetical protein